MAVLANRVKVTTATTGTGTITLGSAVAGYQTFADGGITDGQTVRYVIEDGDNWEIGTGTYTASGTTLTRSVDESNNSDAAINLTGSAVVFISPAEADLIQPGDNISELTNDSGFTTNTGTVTSAGITAGTGISVSGSPITSSGSITVTNTAPDQTVSLTEGSNVTITGTYPNFTIAATDTNTTYTASTGLTLTGTAFSANIGTDIQAWDADLDAIAALAGTSGFLKKTAANTWTLDTSTYLTSYTETDPVVGAISGIVKANGAGTISAAVAGTDYLAPAAIGVTVQAYDADIPTVSASQAEMEAGTEAALRSMSPLRVAQAIAALGGSGGGGITMSTQTFTASGTYTKPSGLLYALVFCTGGGGGGGEEGIGDSGSGGGAGGQGSETSPSSGGNTTFGSHCTGGGGSGGNTNNSGGPVDGGAGGTATGGDINIVGGRGTASGGSGDAPAGGISFWGGEEAYGAGGVGTGDGFESVNRGDASSGVVYVLEFKSA